MGSKRKPFKQYLLNKSKEGDKTEIEINKSVVSFFEEVSTYYEIPSNTAINNILSSWIEEYAPDIRHDIIGRIGKVRIKEQDS